MCKPKKQLINIHRYSKVKVFTFKGGHCYRKFHRIWRTFETSKRRQSFSSSCL